MKIRPRLMTLCALLLPLVSHAKEPAGPPMPYSDPGACPFECCRYRDWTTEKATALKTEMRDDAPAAFKVKKGEPVTGVTGVVITTKPGRAKVTEPISIAGRKARPGEVLYLLTYLGEGHYTAWYNGKLIKDIDATTGLNIVTQPESDWWVKIKNAKGRQGWTKQSDHFGQIDACG